MFETKATLWLQSFSSPILDQFFLLITSLGYETFLQAFMVFIIFGVNVRYGFILSQAIIWTAAIAELFKYIFQYPRPFMVDNRILTIGQTVSPQSPLINQGAPTFFSLIPEKAVSVSHSLFSTYSQSWGIPSGHAAGAVVIWGSLMNWFRQRWVWVFCIALLILVPLSRLYLGMHFLGDLIAGYLLGLAVYILFIRRFFNLPKINEWLFSGLRQSFLTKSSLFFLIVFVLPGCAALFTSSVNTESITLILGTNLGFYFVWLKGVPVASETLKDDAIRLLIAYPLLAIIQFIDWLTDPWLESQLGSIGGGIQEIILNGILVYGGIELLIKLGFMTRGKTT